MFSRFILSILWYMVLSQGFAPVSILAINNTVHLKSTDFFLVYAKLYAASMGKKGMRFIRHAQISAHSPGPLLSFLTPRLFPSAPNKTPGVTVMCIGLLLNPLLGIRARAIPWSFVEIPQVLFDKCLRAPLHLVHLFASSLHLAHEILNNSIPQLRLFVLGIYETGLQARYQDVSPKLGRYPLNDNLGVDIMRSGGSKVMDSTCSPETLWTRGLAHRGRRGMLESYSWEVVV